MKYNLCNANAAKNEQKQLHCIDFKCVILRDTIQTEDSSHGESLKYSLENQVEKIKARFYAETKRLSQNVYYCI